jgi:hypothetical protein
VCPPALIARDPPKLQRGRGSLALIRVRGRRRGCVCAPSRPIARDLRVRASSRVRGGRGAGGYRVFGERGEAVPHRRFSQSRGPLPR